MKKLRIGINGFGRIGRIAARIILGRKNLELGAINSRADSSSHAYLLKYDSTYGILNADIHADHNSLFVNKEKIAVYNADDPADIAWKKEKIDIVIDASGKFRTSELLQGHINGGAKFVVLSAPAKDETKTLVMGVNQNQFDSTSDKIISNSSCTTNCLATTLKVLHDHFKVIKGYMTTIHALTDSQNILDNSHEKEVRLRRASFSSLIPASTGSAKDITKLFPDLSGKLMCQAFRVSLQTVSLINLVVEVQKETTRDEVNNSFKKASLSNLKGILSVADEQLVSRDFTGNPHSSIVDPYLTNVLGGKLIQVSAWYDNEWGYTSRLIDLVQFIGLTAKLL